EGDRADGVYFVISGRLRASVQSDEEKTRTIGEIGRGETVGEMGVLTGEARTATVVAVRDSVLAHASREAFDILLLRDPQLTVGMARIVIERLKRSTRPPVRKPATIALLPITEGVDVRALANDIACELDRWGASTLVTRESVDAYAGLGAAETTQRDAQTNHRVTTWLDEQEFDYDFVLLITDGDTEWTRRCLRQADEVLLVARADAPREQHPLERLCTGDRAVTHARQTLDLLHDESRPHPTGTAQWLDRRPVDAHVHIRPRRARDLARLARIVSGNAVGLVLAGGGARGFAHLGVYKALEEAGVEVDFVGGTSMGAIIAAYISLGHSADALIRFVRKTFARNPTSDVNFLPFLSLIKGARLKAATAQAVVDATGSHDTDVADSWRTLYCVASNYSSAREMVITRGRLERAVRASLAIPVALPPVVWGGELLIDGAVFNNFPTDVMAKMGASKIIGVDLSRRNVRKYDFDELPGTWELLWDRLRGRKRRRYKLPSLGALLLRTTILYSESRGEQARDHVDLFLNPDLGQIGLLDWKGYERAVEIGYQHAKEALSRIPDTELAPYRNNDDVLEELTA
ncbi:MAG TPA: patatin-like phospholipase family protein, partial [Thermoanaerobaculia bacterium]|nr:patatin-like phospholipase family protein [Thermoanaerobaculia bacterium]